MDTINRLQNILTERNLSLYALSKEKSIPYTTIKTAERRGNQLSVETIERLCDALGITLSEFFREDGVN